MVRRAGRAAICGNSEACVSASATEEQVNIYCQLLLQQRFRANTAQMPIVCDYVHLCRDFTCSWSMLGRAGSCSAKESWLLALAQQTYPPTRRFEQTISIPRYVRKRAIVPLCPKSAKYAGALFGHPRSHICAYDKCNVVATKRRAYLCQAIQKQSAPP